MHISGCTFAKARLADTTEGAQLIEFENGTIQVDAEEIARSLHLTPDEVMQGMRSGAITSICEQGQEEDAGRYRLTFYSAKRRLRLTVDAGGAILKRSSSDFTRQVSRHSPDRGPGGAPQNPVPPLPNGGTI